MRITKKDLENMEKQLNLLLKNISVKVCYRYNYVAIDLYSKNNNCIDTLITGLTKKETYDYLSSLRTLLNYEKAIKNP